MTANVEPDHPGGQTEMCASESEIDGLAELAQVGDRASFGQLVILFQKEIFRMVFFRTGSRMDAEDLTQEIFVENLHLRRRPDDFFAFIKQQNGGSGNSFVCPRLHILEDSASEHSAQFAVLVKEIQ